MAGSIYSEVTSISTFGYPRDRVVGKLRIAALNLPYSIDDIKISHNDFAVAEVYNDSILKLYRNYLYLIANAEMVTGTSPTSANLGFINVDQFFTPTLCSTSANPASGNSLSSMQGITETFITKKTDSDNFVFFNYSPNDSTVIESTTELSSLCTILAGNFVEFNKTFKFRNVVCVDIVDTYLFVLDNGLNTLFKFDISGLITQDTAVQRTALISDRPGRYLLKTLGGSGVSQVKNKLNNPQSFSIFNNKIYILDNGNYSVKVFDLNFNYITEARDVPKFKQYGDLVSIVIDEWSDTIKSPSGYILSSTGKIFEYNIFTNKISQPWLPFESYLPFELYGVKTDDLTTLTSRNLYEPESDNFKKIVNSQSSKNILYIASNRNIYTFYKTNLNSPINTFDLTSANITAEYDSISSQKILSFDTVLHNNVDYIAVTTSTLSTIVSAAGHVTGAPVSGYKTSTYIFANDHITSKLYNTSFYTNYFTLSDIYVLPQEIVNNITFNKTTKKLLYNHYSFFENLNKKIYSYYTPNNIGTTIAPAICTINDHEFSKPTSFNDNEDFYIGVNEPLLTDVVNRPLQLLYNQQEDLFNLIKEEYLNIDPPIDIDLRLPGQYSNELSLLSLPTTGITVTAGSSVTITVSRRDDASIYRRCSFYMYTKAGTAKENEFTHIPERNKSIFSFLRGEPSVTITLDTNKFVAGQNRTFEFIIDQKSNCVVHPDYKSVTVTIVPSTAKYDITFDSIVSNTSLVSKTGAGVIARVGVKRYTSDLDYSLSAACNLYISPSPSVGEQLGEGAYTPVVNMTYRGFLQSDDTGYAQDDFPPLLTGNDVMQVSAKHIAITSTLFFAAGVSSIVFDLSAKGSETGVDLPADMGFTIYLHHASNSAVINQAGAAAAAAADLNWNYDTQWTINFNQSWNPITIALSSISATYVADGDSDTPLLSCVNMWDALYTSIASDEANTGTTSTCAFSTVSAAGPVDVTFTVNRPLSVFSTNTSVAALYIKPPSINSFEFYNNKIAINVQGSTGGGTGQEATAVIVGKAGRGGHGARLLEHDGTYGTDFEQDTTNIEVDVAIASHVGVSGGPGLSGFDTYFDSPVPTGQSSITINNAGGIYGGAGGGGGGIVPISASVMPFASDLFAGGGAGGGAGIHLTNCGSGGYAAMGSGDVMDEDGNIIIPQRGDYGDIYLQNGSDGIVTEGGVGKAWSIVSPVVTLGDGSTVDLTTYHAMTGLSGGGLGEAGPSDSSVLVPTGSQPSLSLTVVANELKLRVGGAVGNVITSTVTPICAGAGTYKGS